jgi:hypothetical protein
MMMISIPPDLSYRNLHSLLREPAEAVRGVVATGCVAIDLYALAGLRLQIEQAVAPVITVDLPSDRGLAARLMSSGLFRDLRFVVRGSDPAAASAYRGVPLTRIATAGDVERFAAEVLAAGREARSDLAVRLCTAAAEAGDNVLRHSASTGIAAMEITEAHTELVIADLGAGVRATLASPVGSDGDALLAATGHDQGIDGGLVDVVRRFTPTDGAEIVLRSGHAGLLLAAGATSHEEFGSPIPGTWILVRITQENRP